MTEFGYGFWPLKRQPNVRGPIHMLDPWQDPICGARSPIQQKPVLTDKPPKKSYICSRCRRSRRNTEVSTW